MSPRSSENQCRTCQAPDNIRDLIQKLRVAGVSLQDTVTTLQAAREFAISTAAVSRHEQHWDKEKANSLLSDGEVSIEEITVKDVAKHKLKLYWTAHKDKIPNDTEIRAWMKLLSEMAASETEAEKMSMLRAMFRPALPAPVEVIDVTVVN